ncbi:MAG: DUF1622 domain-containing protein [Chloroflexi bacterium]|nr:DUF1622 domain-containing protein [Chloroflexota bacterium]
MTDIQHVIETIGVAIEVVAVAVIVAGLGYALIQSGVAFAMREGGESAYRRLRNLSARILLLGLELLVAADIVRTVALEPSLASVAVLGLLVVIRTFLSWSLVVEIEGRWPWQAAPGATGESSDRL